MKTNDTTAGSQVEAFERLEPCAGKLARTVPRGVRDSNASHLLYTAKEGDVLDWICWKHYGTASVIEKVLSENPNITDYELSAGTIVNLPYINSIQDKKTEIRLWN